MSTPLLKITLAIITLFIITDKIYAGTNVVSASLPGQFYFWPYEIEGCNNTKDRFLAKTSSIKKVSRSIKNGHECNVIGGRWIDYFTGEELKDAREITVAPIIPLLHLTKLKIQWELSKIISYVHDEESLITFKKGSHSEAAYLNNIGQIKYMPKSNSYQCEFLGMWMDAKIKWSIPFLKNERENVSQAALDCLAQTNFNRLEMFGPWAVVHGHLCQTRTEVLHRDSSIVPSKEYGIADDNCTSNLNGKWFDPYTAQIFTSAKELDIDHVVPLKHAYENGGWKCPHWKKQEYANYMTNPFHLLAVDLRENRSKGSRHPGEYMPPNSDYHCDYVENWIGIKLRWGLPMVSAESEFLLSFIKNCQNLNQANYSAIISLLGHGQK